MIGIYKITSPTKRVYIGQSKNIKRRFKEYKYKLAKGQPRLNNSFLKHGIEKHNFEIICYCNETQLNDLERFYQILFSATDDNGLNCVIVNERDENYYKEIKDKEIRKVITDVIDSIIF
jgi:group I intron endonuclease